MKPSKNFSEFLLVSYHVVTILVQIIILAQKYVKKIPKSENEFKHIIDDVDGILMNNLQTKQILMLKRNKSMNTLGANLLVFLAVKIVCTYRWINHYSFTYLVQVNVSGAIIFYHACKIKCFLIKLSIRIALLQVRVREL